MSNENPLPTPDTPLSADVQLPATSSLRADIRAMVLAVAKEEVDPDLDIHAVTDDMLLREDMGFDSVDVTAVIIDIERRYKITMSMYDMGECTTIGSLVDKLQQKIDAPRR